MSDEKGQVLLDQEYTQYSKDLANKGLVAGIISGVSVASGLGAFFAYTGGVDGETKTPKSWRIPATVGLGALAAGTSLLALYKNTEYEVAKTEVEARQRAKALGGAISGSDDKDAMLKASLVEEEMNRDSWQKRAAKGQSGSSEYSR